MDRNDNLSALCSAFSGETVKQTTVKRGEIRIYESRLHMYGAVQPEPYADLINLPDNQGFFDRVFYMVACKVVAAVEKFRQKLFVFRICLSVFRTKEFQSLPRYNEGNLFPLLCLFV